ncbi:MAG TPA: DNA double-strand break repair nuclease NurA [Ktedonobacterales bacterium]
MASFTDLVAGRIRHRRQEFLAGLSPEPQGSIEDVLEAGVQSLWRPLAPDVSDAQVERFPPGLAAAVDGSRALRALNSGTDWVVAQALLVGPDGLRLAAADTILLRGEIERPAVDRCAALVMRALELGLALKFAQSGSGNLLLLDGSLYADLPHLLYSLAVPGREDLPLLVLQRYLDLFACCQAREILLLGLAKSARSTVLGRAILDGGSQQTHRPASHATAEGATGSLAADALETVPNADVAPPLPTLTNPSGWSGAYAGLPTDAEILHRWTAGAGYCAPILLGTASFGHRRGPVTRDPGALAEHFGDGQFSAAERRDILRRLPTAPAIGTFYVRFAPGDDALRVDAPASAFGYGDQRLLDFPHRLLPHQAAVPLVERLLGDYGGASVYNAALYVVDHEVRLGAATVDQVYLSVLRRQLGIHVQYDRSTRRFVR